MGWCTAKGYLNGELGFTTPISGLTSIRSGGFPRRLGSRNNNYLDGDMGISRLYSKALTAAEVTQNFNAQRNRFGI